MAGEAVTLDPTRLLYCFLRKEKKIGIKESGNAQNCTGVGSAAYRNWMEA